MTDKLKNSPKLYQLIKQYEIMSNTDQAIDIFSKAYEFVLQSLDKGKNECIHESLQEAAHQKQSAIYEEIFSLTLSTIHRINYIENDKNYCSTLFITPYFTITDNDNDLNNNNNLNINNSNVIHYPPVQQIEDIFRKHFLDNNLIDDVSQLHIPGIKISADNAYEFDFSDWFKIHKEALSKMMHPETDQFYSSDVSIPIHSGGDLSFFPILIIYEDNDIVLQPSICDLERKDLSFEEALESVERDVSLLSGTGTWAVGIPSHCENALDFGLEIQQDFALDTFFKQFCQREDIEIALFPISDTDSVLLAWNTEHLNIESTLELSCYSCSEEEFIESMIKQVHFYEIAKTYIFEDNIGFSDIDNLDDFDLEQLSSEHNVLVVEKSRSSQYTLH